MNPGVSLVIGLVFGFAGYQEAGRFAKRHGRTPWGWAPVVWGIVCFLSFLIGLVLLAIAERVGRNAAAKSAEYGRNRRTDSRPTGSRLTANRRHRRNRPTGSRPTGSRPTGNLVTGSRPTGSPRRRRNLATDPPTHSRRMDRPPIRRLRRCRPRSHLSAATSFRDSAARAFPAGDVCDSCDSLTR
jgi:hypothetical protein